MKSIAIIVFALFSSVLVSQVTDLITSGLIDPFDVVVEGNTAYIVEFNGNTISSLALDNPDASLQDVVSNITLPTTLLFDDDDVYIAQVTGIITRRDASDLVSNQTTITTGLTTPVSLIRFENFLYFSEFQGNRIGRIDLENGNTVETVIPGLSFPEQMVLIEDQVYVNISGTGSIGRFTITDPNPQIEIVANGFNTPAGIVAIGEDIFITEFVTNGEIFNIDVSESSATTTSLVGGLNNPFGIATFENSLIFVQNGNNRLSRYDGDLLSINETRLTRNDILIYPNPTRGNVTITSKNDIATINTITLYDAAGQEVRQINLEASPVSEIALGVNLKAGFYIAAIQTTAGTTFRKIVVE